ncbi:DUF485 domain-containing protein [Kitasatospora xanthocidica]|uniref:DUF485 domain-containing protein n=1 Tax=Kitasatospora xanthocidica TaxID=83382 RepID=UPI0036EB4A97
MPQQQTSSPGQGQRFDWWAAPAAATPSGAVPSDPPVPGAALSGVPLPGAPSGTPSEPPAPHRRTAVPAQPAPVRTAPVRAERSAPVAAEPVAGTALVGRSAGPAAGAAPGAAPALAAEAAPAATDSTEVYRAVQASAAFQDIRHSYRSFVFPVTGVFLGWYLMYVAAQAAAPGLMRIQVAGPFNVAWLLGLLQFASTFLLTWLYARNARTKRDRAALGLRWDTQDQLR